MEPNILIVDDEPYMTELIQRLIRENTAYHATTVSQSTEVPQLLDRDLYSLVFLDLRMPGMDGMELLREIKRRHPQIGVIIVSAYGTIATAVEALQHGAADFITKPFVNQELLAVMERVLKMQDLARENLALRKALAERHDLTRLIGNGPRMRALSEEAASLAQNAAPVLLLGEFGTGKSFLARALHFNGPRASGPFLNLDLASVDAGEMEQLIFGQREEEQGECSGLLAQAEGGTLHLAGIGRLTPILQNRLADWLEQGRFRPQGAQHMESADVRLVASGESELDDLLGQGQLEPRLGSLLSRFILRLPPLRARREDIPLLASRFLEKYSALYGKEVAHLGDEAVKWFLAHDWPGNLREMENTMERAVLMSQREVIEYESLDSADTLGSNLFAIDYSALDQSHSKAIKQAKAQFLRAFEERYLRHHLSRGQGDMESLRGHTGLSDEKLRNMIARTNLSLERYRRSP